MDGLKLKQPFGSLKFRKGRGKPNCWTRRRGNDAVPAYAARQALRRTEGRIDMTKTARKPSE